MEKKISKNQRVYPHCFGCSQNHPKAPKKPILVLKPLSPKALKPLSPKALKPLSTQALKLLSPQALKP